MNTSTRFLSAALLLSLALLTAAAAVPRIPITHELLWMMKRVGPRVVSPDGKWVVFSVLEPSYETDKESSDLWLVPADGSAPAHRITNTRTPEGGVSWSPDSHSIAFSSKREGDESDQIYVLDLVGGGEAHRLTRHPVGHGIGANRRLFRHSRLRRRRLLPRPGVEPGRQRDRVRGNDAALERLLRSCWFSPVSDSC
jgi:hypothetical protein